MLEKSKNLRDAQKISQQLLFRVMRGYKTKKRQPKNPRRKVIIKDKYSQPGTSSLSYTSLMNMKLVKDRHKPVMIVRTNTLTFKLRSKPPSVSVETNKSRIKHRAEEINGDKNQLATISPIFDHPIESKPSPTKPAPTKPPTTACVPLIGIPKTEELIMNKKDEMHAPSICLEM